MLARHLNQLPTPTILEYAALSLDVYYERNDFKRPSLPLGWTRFMDSDCYPDGYFGALYIKNITNPTCFVYAHRGTVFNKIGNLIADLQIALEKVPLQYNSALDFGGKATEAIYKLYVDLEKIKNVSITNTGHSLGAIFAELFSLGIYSVTFENPGSKNIIIKVLRDIYEKLEIPSQKIETAIEQTLLYMSQNCHIYQRDVNLINTCNQQVGKIFQLLSDFYDCNVWDKGPYVPISSSYILNPYYLGYTHDQHSMIKIFAHLKSNGKVKEIIDYPFGLNNGYISYLDGEARSEYLKGYSSLIWNRNPDIQKEFDYKFDIYLLDFKKQLKMTQQKALKVADFSSTNLEVSRNTSGIFYKDAISMTEDIKNVSITNNNSKNTVGNLGGVRPSSTRM